MSDNQEIESLRSHNAELLADLKKARTKLKETIEQLEALTTERDAAKSELLDLRLHRPVEALLDRLSPLPEFFKQAFEARGYRFALDDDGKVVVRDAEGQPVKILDKGEPKEVQFDEKDISYLVLETGIPESERSASVANFEKLLRGSQATGGGAPGGTRMAATKREQPAEKPTLQAGLR